MAIEPLVKVRILRSTLAQRLPAHLQGPNAGEVVGVTSADAKLLIDLGVAELVE